MYNPQSHCAFPELHGLHNRNHANKGIFVEGCESIKKRIVDFSCCGDLAKAGGKWRRKQAECGVSWSG